jgi:hypothetical protein
VKRNCFRRTRIRGLYDREYIKEIGKPLTSLLMV